MGITCFLVNVMLVLLTIRVPGFNFGLKTIYSLVVITIALTFSQNILKEPLTNDLFLSSVLGGRLAGVGLGIVFSRGGSTGGTDIIASLINK